MSGNLFAPTASASCGEVIETLVETGSLKLERVVSTGQSTPAGKWYDQDRDEWVALLTGSATIRFEDPEACIALAPGDWVVIPAHRRHRVEETAGDRESIWIAAHFER